MFCDRTDIAKPGLDTKRMVVGPSGPKGSGQKNGSEITFPPMMFVPNPIFKIFQTPLPLPLRDVIKIYSPL